MKKLPTIAEMPAVPTGLSFSLDKIETVSMPHPYCITPRHLTGDSMILDAAAIERAEKENGAVCDICRENVKRGRQSSILTYAQHEQTLTLFIYVPKGTTDLNAVKGLHKYLLSNKPAFEKLGIGGFAFPPQP